MITTILFTILAFNLGYVTLGILGIIVAVIQFVIMMEKL